MREGRLRERNGQLARDVVLDAAKRLLRRSATAEFSMRELAAEAIWSLALGDLSGIASQAASAHKPCCPSSSPSCFGDACPSGSRGN